jgi:hypothetical protein
VLGRIGPAFVAPAYQNTTFGIRSGNDYGIISRPNLWSFNAGTTKTGNNNTWHNVIMVVDREKQETRVYYEGKIMEINTISKEILLLTPWGGNPLHEKICIGGGYDYAGCNVRKFQGTIDEIYIWNKALSQKEVNGVYENQK